MASHYKGHKDLKDTDYSDKENWPQGADAEAMMECLMGNYLMQNEIIRTKLHHARKATRDSLKDLEKMAGDTKPDKSVKELGKIKKLDTLWQQLIDLLAQIGLAEDDIKNIETTITSTPKVIREYYDILVEQDRSLSNLIYEMESDTFADAHHQAKQVSGEIQSQPNPMSGLDPEEYEAEEQHIISTSGFEIITLPNFRENR